MSGSVRNGAGSALRSRLMITRSVRILWHTLALLLLLSFTATPCLAFGRPDRAQILFDQSRFDLMNGDAKTALDKLRRAQEIRPGDKRFPLWRVRVLDALGRSDQALALVERLVEKDPETYAPLHFTAAGILWEQGRRGQALEHLRRAESFDKARALRTQMDYLLEDGDYEAAVQAGSRLGAAKARERQEILLLIARAQYANYEYPQALDTLTRARRADPSSALVRDIDELERRVRLTDRPWWLGVNAAYQYDSNVFLDPVVEDPAHAVASGRADSALLSEAWGGARLARYRGWSLALTAHAQRMDFFRESDASYMYWSPGMLVSWGKARWGVSLSYNFYYYYHEGRMDDWSRIHSVTPAGYWQMTRHLKTYFTVVALERQYFDGRSGANHIGGIVDHVYTFERDSDFVRLSYRYDEELAFDEVSGYRGWEVTLAGGKAVYDGLNLEAGVTYAHYDFDKRQEWTLNYQVFERQDDQIRLYAGLYLKLPDWWQLGLTWYYLKNDSNVQSDISPYDYDKYVIMFSVTKNF